MAKPSSRSRVPQKLAAYPSGDFRADDLSLASRISWWALLAMVFLVPVAMSNFGWLGFKMPITYDQFDIIKVFLLRVLGLVALASWAWDMLVRGGKIRHTPVDWLILAFLAWVTVSTFLSISPAIAFFGKYRRFEGLLSFINYAVIYFLVLQYADRPSRVRALAETLFWSSVLVAGYGFLQSVGLDPVPWGDLPFEKFRPFSTYGNPDLLGGFLMFSLPIALGLALAEERVGRRLIYWVGFGVNAYVWIVAFTRGAWIGGAVGVIVLAFIAWRHSAKVHGVDWIPVGITGAAGVGAIVRSLSNPNEVMNFSKRFASIVQFDTGSGLTRTEIWQAAAKAVTYSPLRFVFGWGADTFRLVFPKFKPYAYTNDAGYLSVADNVHDYPLQLAAGIGVVGVLLMYSVFVWAGIRSAKLVFAKSDDARRILLGAFWAACAGYLVQLMFGLSVTGNTFLLWTAMAVLLAPGAKAVSVKPVSWGTAAGFVIAVLAVAGIAYQVVFMAADHQYLLARVRYSGAQRTAATLEARKLNPFNDMYRAEVGLAYIDEVIDSLNSAMRANQAGQDTTGYMRDVVVKFGLAEGAMEDVIKFVPYEYDNYVFISNLYNLGGQTIDRKYYDDAVSWGRKGVKVEPFGPAVRVQLAKGLQGQAETLRLKGDTAAAAAKDAEATKELETAWKMDNKYAESTLMLAEAYKKAGRTADAIKVLKANIAVQPGAGVQDLLNQLESSATTTP